MREVNTVGLLCVILAFGSASAESIYWSGEQIRDHEDNLLAIGSMVQLIKAGPDGINNDAVYTGDGCTGDDQVVQAARIGDGWGSAGAGRMFAEFSGAVPGAVYYVRAWSAPSLAGNVPAPPALYNDSFLWTFVIGETPFPVDQEFDFSGPDGWATTRVALPSEDLFVPPLKDWVVYEGRLLRQFVSTAIADQAMIKREPVNVLLVIHTQKPQTNGLMIAWSKASGTNEVVSASLEDYAASAKVDKIKRPVAARGVVALSINEEGADTAVLLGISTWAGRYNASTGDLSGKRSVTLAGRALSFAAGEEGYATETLRYNQLLSDRMSGAGLADAEAILKEYVAGRAKVSVGEIDLTTVTE